jgi:aryl-alcohol dehydrogenase-like predicted oxidoreductase
MGIGCVGMSNIYGAADESESTAAIRFGLESGITVLDTADSYGPPAQSEGHNESLVGRAIAGRRANATIVTKVGISLDSDFLPQVDARPEVIRHNCDESLQRLGIDAIDLYLLHRVDPRVPVEDSVGAIAELVEAGKVRQIGLCEVTGQTLRQAARVHPIAAIESEWSLWSRDIKSRRDLADQDLRSTLPRFQEEQIQRNLVRLADMEKMAATRDCTLAQLALAWLLAQGEDVVPIPGLERVKFVRENLGALEVTLTAQDLERLDSLFPVDGDYGERYNEGHARFSANSE